jgi:hypothetical protein
MQRTLEFDGTAFPFSWWNGEQLKGTVDCPLALDTETAPIPPYRQPLPDEDPLSLPPSPVLVPPVAVGLAYDGTQLVLIHPDRLGEFAGRHRSQQWVGHNLSFDFWVLQKHADDTGNNLLKEYLWRLGDDNRLCDTAVLDLLLQLGTGSYRMGKGKGKAAGGDDKKLLMTNLAVLSEEWGCGELDKTDPYRLRFGEWVGKSEAEIEAHPEFDGFASYALKDVIVTWRIYPKQRRKAVEIMRKAGWRDDASQKTFEIRPDALKVFGPLSEYVQVKGAIALDRLSRTPVYIDVAKRAELEQGTRDRYQTCMDDLMQIEPDLFRKWSPKAKKGVPGTVRRNPKTGLPQLDNGVLKGRLAKVAVELNVDPPISDGKRKDISLSAQDWMPIAEAAKEEWQGTESVRFLRAWCGMGSEVKLLSFFLSLDTPDGKAYSGYNLLMRTGRTSAQAHRRDGKLLVPSFNIQQMPRDSPKHPERSVRTLFLPPPGHRWLSLDYGYVELCSLAAVCKARFGWSKLAETIVAHRTKGGLDPHQRTAAMLLGVTPEQFLRLDKDDQKKARQAAKAVNFGRPGGLGDETFTAYAFIQYGVRFTKKEAKEAKLKWMEVYPEAKEYLSDPTELAMRWQSDRQVAPKMSYLQRRRLSEYLKMSDAERSAKSYSGEELERFWDLLEWIAKAKADPELAADIQERKVTTRVRNLTTYRACTLTGRVRNNVTFTSGANTPFQGAAADGSKLALWNLMRRGIHLLGFVHDSIEVAVPAGKENSIRPVVEKVMVDSMQFVLGQGIPVAVDGAIAPNWSKA